MQLFEMFYIYNSAAAVFPVLDVGILSQTNSSQTLQYLIKTTAAARKKVKVKREYLQLSRKGEKQE